MKVRVTLNCHIKRGQFELLLPFLEKNLPHVRGFNGSLGVTVYFDKEHSELLLEEEWLSTEHHLAYIEHIEKNGVLGELASYFSQAPVIKYFEKTDL